MSNRVKVLFFATLKAAVGLRDVSIELADEATVADIRRSLVEQYPDLESTINSALVSINRQFAFNDEVVPLNAELAFFPPVSGGSSTLAPTICLIVEDAIDANQVIADVTSATTGAVVLFTGVVRGITSRDQGRVTDHLEYEAYHSMAIVKMQQIGDEIRLRWPKVESVAIVQRIGELMPGDVSVMIACSSAHRDDGVFDAARFGIDRLKEIVPIWKKEVGPAGNQWIEGSYLPRAGE